MPTLPEGTDRNTLVVVVPREVPEGHEIVEHVVGAAWLQSPQGAEDFEFLRFDGETPEQAEAREKAAAAVQTGADQVGADSKAAKQTTPVDRFAQQ